MTSLYPIILLDIYKDNVFDAAAEKAKGIRGVIIKAGQGGYASLPLSFVAQCQAIGLPYGFYWVIDSRYDSGYHINAIKQTFPTMDFGKLGFWWDCEKPNWTMTDTEYWKTPYAGSGLIEAVTDKFFQWCFETGGMYTSPGFAKLLNWNSSVFKLSEFGRKLALMPLWVAQYNSTITHPDLFGNWSDWLLWQYREGPDLSYFNGDENKFIQMFGLQDIPIPPSTQEKTMIYEKTYFDGLIKRQYQVMMPHGLTTYQVTEIETSKAEFFVSPQLAARKYVPDFLDAFDLDFACNGDGFLGVTIAGFAASEGNPYGTVAQEATVYIGQDNIFTKSRPAVLWNAISYPNLLVQNGQVVKINKALDDIRARTAFGWNLDQSKLFIVTVDGQDYWSHVGLNFPDTAKVLIELGCSDGFMLDGGGSTTEATRINGIPTVTNKPSGEDLVARYNMTMRRVANVLGVRMKTGSVSQPPPTGEANMNYKVMVGVKPRKTPSMYEINTKPNLLVNTTFASTISETVNDPARVDNGVTFVQMSDGYWVPLVYKGVEYVKEIVTPVPATKGRIILTEPDGATRIFEEV